MTRAVPGLFICIEAQCTAKMRAEDINDIQLIILTTLRTIAVIVQLHNDSFSDMRIRRGAFLQLAFQKGADNIQILFDKLQRKYAGKTLWREHHAIGGAAMQCVGA